MFQLQAPIPLEGDIDLSAEGLTRMVAERTARDDIRIQSVSWASVYSMNARLADRYRVGRVFLVGDAAHIHPPTGGQGLNTSVQDSYNLGWKLKAVLAGAPDTLLDTYEEERRPIAAGMLGLATKLLDAAQTEAPEIDAAASDSAAGISDLGVGAADNTAPLIAHVRDLATGEIGVFNGTREIVVRDPQLARRILRAAG